MMSSLKRQRQPIYSWKKNFFNSIQELHFKIWESSDDPLKEGYDMMSYEKLEKRVIENCKLCSRTPEQGFELPKVTIQKFNGDYLKWRAFHDSFTQLIYN